MNHSERCRREATRDVIFIFQSRRRTFIKEPEGYAHDGEGWNRLDDDGEIIESDTYVTDDEVAEADSECYIDIWLPEGVWLDRDEAEAWGEAHNYRF
jgi:hypothetical protein